MRISNVVQVKGTSIRCSILKIIEVRISNVVQVKSTSAKCSIKVQAMSTKARN